MRSFRYFYRQRTCFCIFLLIIFSLIFYLILSPYSNENDGFVEQGSILHDYTKPGEMGKSYKYRVNSADNGFREYGINMAASNAISLDRSLSDTRSPECARWNYPTNLPTTSVIVVFHNEGLSVLLRTIHSVINRSPKYMLHEVILVDDVSTKSDLKKKLIDCIEKWNGLVKLVRNEKREGLIQSRSRGAKEATGDILVFLDAHCEVNTMWLEPLVTPIYEDSTTMTVPIIDGINNMNFEYIPVYNKHERICGIFEWGFYYKERLISLREAMKHKYITEPYNCPTNAGGLFAINRKYFFKLGAYDPGLLAWGGENYELSFKIWQCGGNIKWVPCSRVGHIYRPARYNFNDLANKRRGSLTTGNYRRVIETWFDEEHRQYFYTRDPMSAHVEMGDISQQLALKEKLQCKSFGWFMENVAYDLYKDFPKLPVNAYWGTFRSLKNGQCLDTLGREPPATLGMSGCHGQSDVQIIRLNVAGQLGVGERCIDISDNAVKVVFCKLGTVDGPWSYSKKTKQLKFSASKCLSVKGERVIIDDCIPKDLAQKWLITEPEIK